MLSGAVKLGSLTSPKWTKAGTTDGGRPPWGPCLDQHLDVHVACSCAPWPPWQVGPHRHDPAGAPLTDRAHCTNCQAGNISHRIHGAGIYANIKEVYWWDPCYHIYSIHGSYGSGNNWWNRKDWLRSEVSLWVVESLTGCCTMCLNCWSWWEPWCGFQVLQWFQAHIGSPRRASSHPSNMNQPPAMVSSCLAGDLHCFGTILRVFDVRVQLWHPENSRRLWQCVPCFSQWFSWSWCRDLRTPTTP